MEIDLLEEEGKKLKIKVIGEGHSFCNALRKELHQDENVEMAAYNIDHPLVAEPVMHVKTSDDGSPREALIKASDSLAEDYAEVGEKLEKAFEK